jgi:hypothetical protein
MEEDLTGPAVGRYKKNGLIRFSSHVLDESEDVTGGDVTGKGHQTWPQWGKSSERRPVHRGSHRYGCQSALGAATSRNRLCVLPALFVTSGGRE